MKGFIIYLAKTLAISTVTTVGTFGGLIIISKIDSAIEERKSKKEKA